MFFAILKIVVVGLGTDIVEISRLSRWLDNESLLLRYFSREELGRLSRGRKRAMETLAGFFAAKESFIKALRESVPLRDIVLEKTEKGNPQLRLRGRALEAMQAQRITYTLVSIAHERKYAVATVLLCRGDDVTKS